MKNNGIKRFISAALAVLLMLGGIGFSPFGGLVAAAAPTSTMANYNQFQVKLTADPVTDAAPAGSPGGFGTADSAGRIWTDKSVTAESDGSFGVKLSTLAQEYVTSTSENPGVGGDGNANAPAADVTFILDMSQSMGSSGNDIGKPGGGTYYRVQAMAMAANNAIRTVMNANPKNRVAVYWFGNAVTANHLGTMMDLGHYVLAAGHENEDYLVYASDYSITPNSNLKKDGQPYSGAKVSLGAGTPTQDGIMYGISKTIKDLGTRGAGPKRQPYVFILSDGAAVNAKKAWYTSPKGKSFENDFNNALTDAVTIANYNRASGTDNNYVPASTSGGSLTNTGDPDIAALTTLTGAYMKKLIGDKYTAYNGGESTDPKFYTVGLGSETAINGPYNGNQAVYSWAGLDPKILNDNKTNSSFRNGSAVATYNKLTTYAASGPSGVNYSNAFVYSNFYTFASSYDALSGAFNGLASDVEASTTILPLLDIPAGGGLGGSETAEIASAIVFVDEIGDGFAVDTSTLKIGDTVAAIDTSLSITGGTAYKFAGYGSKAVIQTVGGVTSLTWYIDSADMQPHIYRFTNRTSPVEGQYTAPTNGSFALNYKVKPAFTISPASVVDLAYYLNSGNAAGGAKTAAYFTPPGDSPYYAGLTNTRVVSKTGGIGATYVTEESLSGNRVAMKLGNNGRLDLEMGIVKSGPTTVQPNGTINYTVAVYNYTGTPKTGLNITSEGQIQSGITVPANGSKVLTFSATAPGTSQTITSGSAEVSGIGLVSNTVTTNVTVVNGPPVAAGQNIKTNKDVAKPIMLSGTDDLTSVTDLVYHVPNTTLHGGTLTQIGTSGAVIYTPAPGYIGTDSFTFTITDESGLESNTATVNITVNGNPSAAGNTFETSENVSLTEQVVGTDPNGDILTYIIGTQAENGTVTMGTYGAFTYVPVADYAGEDSFTFKVTDEDGLESDPVTVTITIMKSLDGWVGNNRIGVIDPPVIVGPGAPLKLSAISSIFATAAKATVTYKIVNEANTQVDQTDMVDLVVNQDATTLVSKQWTNVNYRLNDKAVAGSYTVTYTTYKQDTLFQTEPSDRLADNHFSIVTKINLVGKVQKDEETGPDLPLAGTKVTLYDPTGLSKVAETTTDANGGYSFEGIATKKYLIVVDKQGYASKRRVINALPTTTSQTEIRQDFLLVNFGLGLTATPTSIVGDGNTTSVLKALITDHNGEPIPNIEVVFDAQSGTFPGGTTAMTNSNGIASVVFKSAKIEGILSQLVPVTATVNDDANGLHDTAQILITFEPASVVGQITNTTTVNGHTSSSVLAGVPIKLTADFDGDGIIDFSAETVTDSDGKYSIAVPRGDKPYHLEVIRTENIGGVATPVSYQQIANVGIVTGAGNENFKSEKTATGMVLFKQHDGTEEGKSSLPSSALKNNMKVYVKKSDGTYVEDSPGHPKSFDLSNQGVFNVEGLAVNEAYTLDFAYEVEPGKEIVLSHRTVQVSADGEMNITQELIDPYGKVTDAVTHNPLVGAHVVLYYAGTTTGVVLPGIAGFAPNDNASPDQYTDASGDYAYMVFPDTDYKLVVSKAGYYTKTIDNIHVGKDIVKQDFTLDPVPPSDGTPSVPAAPAPTGITLNLSVDKNLVQEGGNSTITVDYTNPTATTIKDGKITVTVPDGAKIVDADGGTVDGNTITWLVTDLPAGQAGSHHIVVKWPQISAVDADFNLQGQFMVGGNGVNAVKASSAVKVKVFSDRFDRLQHQRYILGYPDGTFKTNNALTRAELAAIVARLTENVKINATLTFSDVPETHWAANYIKIVTKHGFFNGFEDGTFRPEAPVTRAELASVMVRFLKLNVGVTGEYHFTDVQGHWAAQAIEELYREKFLAGYPDGTFKPAANIARVEAVTLINRMLYRGPLTGISPLFPDVSSTYWGFGDIMEASSSHVSTRNVEGSEAWLKKIEDDVQ